jgi:hypothetical protein
MKKFATGAQSYPLTTGNNSLPDVTQDDVTTFFLRTVPDRAPTGPLAYILPFLILTVYGTVHQTGTGGSVIQEEDLIGALIDSIDWNGTYFGTPVSGNFVFGRNIPVSQVIAGGYRKAMRTQPPIGPAAGDTDFTVSIMIPAASCMLGGSMIETSQLAILFKGSQIDINWAPASVLAGLSSGATFTDLKARCSAIVYPTTDLILGTPVEQVLHQVTAGTGGDNNQVTIEGFGRKTMLTNVEKQGGVVYLGELTDVGLQNGVFVANEITQFAFDWRGQVQQKHIEALLSPALLAMPNDRPQTMPLRVTGGDAEFNSFPYAQGTDDSSTLVQEHFSGLRIFPMVYGDDSLQLSDLQTADQDEDYFLNVESGFSAGAHQILGFYAKRWQASFRDAWVKTITDGGAGSLAAYVLGKDWAKATLSQRLPSGRHVVTADQMTYLAWMLA